MLKVLIIDDDTLTRKGIQALMPWAEHDMEIVGEASNGKAALEFLEEHYADVALVDLDMPVMDGLSFIKEAKKLYPCLNYVVLTVHTEFEYIQNVLRLGAIDYIAKTRFDQENFHQILERIYTSIAQKISLQQNLPNLNWYNCQIFYPFIYALVTIESDTDEYIHTFLEKNELLERKDLYELLPGVWVFTDERSSFLFPETFPNTTLLCISDVGGMTYKELEALLRNYKKEQFFYDYQPIKKINHKRAYELSENKYVLDEQEFERLKKEWLSLNWIYENDLFNKIRFDLKNSHLKFSSLYHLLLSLENVWNSSYSQLTGDTLKLPPVFHCWTEIEEWLMQIYEKASVWNSTSKYSSEMIQNILNVKQYVSAHLSEDINAVEIARNTHMSYGYFSRCFRDIAGTSFQEYCISTRIEKAKDYLLHTTRTIQQIAGDVGYNDEKYFSRIFKKQTGTSPSTFRKSTPPAAAWQNQET
ncbi:MAG: response regulator [Clostridiales bacterium]|nr:response regulator [Clostridiales bacterium]